MIFDFNAPRGFERINGTAYPMGGHMQGATGLLQSRRFLTMVVYALISVILYFVGKYAGAAMEDVKFLIAALLPIALAIIVAYTVDDAQATRLEMLRAELAAKQAGK